MMNRKQQDGLRYLRTYPRLAAWINRCVACQRLGHKPELPDQLGKGRAAQNLRQYFPEMAVNERGLCDQCAGSGDRNLGKRQHWSN
jgi:hypothetical protein